MFHYQWLFVLTDVTGINNLKTFDSALHNYKFQQGSVYSTAVQLKLSVKIKNYNSNVAFFMSTTCTSALQLTKGVHYNLSVNM